MSIHTIRMMNSHHSNNHRVKFPRNDSEIAIDIRPKKSLSEEFHEAEEHGRRMAMSDINYAKLVEKWGSYDYDSDSSEDKHTKDLSIIGRGCSIQ